MRKFLAALLLALFASVPAQAKWYEASSEHFVIYADDSEEDILRFAENLERYHSAMSLVTGREIETPSPSNRVVIFVAGGKGDMRELTGSRWVGGFYVARAGASRAFVQTIRNKSGYPHFSTVILLHEYAHHFLISSARHSMPRWLGEGAAEFFAASSFDSEGGMQLGMPARHRANEISYAGIPPVEYLLDPKAYAEGDREASGSFYGASWALFHMLIFDETRQGQLTSYWKLLNEGAGSLDAGKQAFGDLEQLDKDLKIYLKQKRMSLFRIAPGQLTTRPVTLRELPKGEAKMMEVRMVSQRGVTREEALELVEEARKIAAKYPDDAGVQVALAEAEFDAGFNEAAIAAADRAIALDPSRPNAYVQKGYAQFSIAEEAEDKDAAYASAMETFSALNRLENDHPAPLIHYYRSFIERGAEPTETARHALERASQLAPFDKALAMNAAMMQAGEGKIALALVGLSPVANNPHGGELADTARLYVAQLEPAEEGPPWQPEEIEEKATGNEAKAPVAADAAKKPTGS